MATYSYGALRVRVTADTSAVAGQIRQQLTQAGRQAGQQAGKQAAAGVTSAMDQGTKSVGSSIKNMATNVASAATRAASTVSAGFARAGSAAVSAAATAGQAFTRAAAGAASAVGSGLARAFSAVQGAAGRAASAAGSAFTRAFGPAASAVTNVLGRAFSAVQGAAGRAASAAGAVFSRAFGPAGAAVTNVLGRAFSAVQSAAGRAASAAGTVWTRAVAPAGSAITSSLGRAFEAVSAAASRAGAAAGTALSRGASAASGAITNGLSRAWSAVSTAGSRAASAVGSGMTRAASSSASAVTNALGRAWSAVSAAGGRAAESITAAFSRTGSAIGAAMNRPTGGGAGGGLGGMLTALKGMPLAGKAAAAGMAILGGSVLKTGIQYNTLMQTSRAAFTTVLGSAQAADEMLNRIQKFAATSPFPRQAFIEATQQMVSFGIASNKVIPYLSAIQDSVAATGGNAQTLSDITLVMSQIQSAGRITGVDLMQFAQRGINAADLIGKAMGKSGTAIKEEIGSGAFDATKALDALVKGMDMQFGGASDNLKTTWAGTVDSVKGAMRDMGSALVAPFIDPKGGGYAVSWGQNLANAIRSSLPAVRSVMTGLATVIGWVAQGLNLLGGILGRFSGWLLPLAGAIGTVMLAIKTWQMIQVAYNLIMVISAAVTGGFSSAITSLWLALAFNPIGVIVLAVIALVAAFAIAWQRSAAFRNFWIGLWDGIRMVTEAAWRGVVAAFTWAWNAITAVFRVFVDWINAWFTPWWQQNSEAFARIWTGVSAVLSAVWTVIRAVFGAGMTYLTAVWQIGWTVISAVVRAIWPVLVAVVQAGWTVIRGIFQVAMAVLQAIWSVGWAVLSGYVRVVWAAVQAILQIGWAVIIGLFTFFLNVITGRWGAAWTALKVMVQTIWSAISGFLGTALSALVGVFSAAWTGIRNVVAAALNAIKASAVAIWNAIRTYIAAVLSAINAVITSVWNSIKGYLAGVWNWIRATLTAVWNWARNFTSQVWTAIAGSITAIWNGIRNSLTAVWNWVRGALAALWNWARQFTAQVWAAIAANIAAVWNGIRNTLTSVWNWFRGGLSGTWNWARGFTAQVWAAIGGVIGNAWNGIKSTVNTAITWVRNKINEVWNLIKVSTGQQWGAIVKALSNAWEGVKRAVGSPIKFVVDKLVNPLIKGINALITKIKIPAIPEINSRAIPAFRKGGRVPGGWGGGDRQPILAEPGEWVLTKHQARGIGYNTLRSLPRYAEGGMIQPFGPFDWVGKAAGAVGGAARKGLDTLVGMGKDVVDEFSGMLRWAAAEAFEKLTEPLRKLAQPMADSDIVFPVQYLGKLALDILDKAVEFIQDKSAPEFGDMGGIVDLATSFNGHRYVWGGGANEKTGFDCSSFINMLAGMVGLPIPGNFKAPSQAHGPVTGDWLRFPTMQTISLAQIQPGDIGVNSHHIILSIGTKGEGFAARSTATGTGPQKINGSYTIRRWPGGGAGGGSYLDPASLAKGIGPVSPKGGMNNLAIIARYLATHGWSLAGAAGVAGNVYQESLGDPLSFGTGGRGLIGWTPPGRLPNSAFIPGNVGASMAAQLPLVDRFFRQNMGRFWQVANAQSDPGRAALVVMNMGERPAGSSQSNPFFPGTGTSKGGLRQQVARQVYGVLVKLQKANRMANGGIIREPVAGIGRSGRIYQLAERGPELVTPLGGGTLDARELGSTAHGRSLTINVYPRANQSEEQVAASVARRLAWADAGGMI